MTVLYSLKQKHYEKDMVILKQQEAIETIYIIMYGQLEIYTEMEGNEFVIERLNKGSIINHNMFLMDDVSQVNIRASESSHVLEFNRDLYE